jgi:RNA polymerase sigma factor (sigma-70 family)
MATKRTTPVITQLRKALLMHDAAGLTDGQLLGSFIERRDEAAFAALVKHHGPMVWGVCRRLLREHDAEDAFQATFLVLVRKAASIMPREMVANWLYGVAHQTALHSRRTAVRRTTRERQVAHMPEPLPSEQVPWHDLQPLLDQELARLPDKYRVAIVLCDLEGKTRKEAARQLDCPEGTLAARLARGRVLLAKRLARHGLAISGGGLAALLAQSPASAGVPPSLVASTIKAATVVATGQAAAGVLSTKVVALMAKVSKTMLLTKLRIATAVLLVLSILGTSVAVSHDTSAPGGIRQGASKSPEGEAKKNQDEQLAVNEDLAAHYCSLVFGPKGKVRTLMRLRGDEVAVDRDGDGKFDSKGERFASEKDCKDIVIRDPDGKTSYVITEVHLLHVVPPEKFLEVRVHIRGSCSYPQGCIVQMAENAKHAPWAHFHGPLIIAPESWTIENRASSLLRNELADISFLVPHSVKNLAGKGLGSQSTLPSVLRRTGEPTKLCAAIYTKGDQSIVAVCSPAATEESRRQKSPFPRGIHPFVDVEFPAKKPTDPPLKIRVPLDQFCCDGIYHGSLKVPAEAGVGKAKATFSFDAWKGINVLPTTHEISIEDPQVDKKAQSQ